MGSQGPKLSKRTKPSSLSSHLAMVELKQRILNSLSKLSDRDTHQIAIEDLENIIETIQNDAVPMLLNCLFEASTTDPKPTAKKESLRLLAAVCAAHPEITATHLVKIIAHIAKRLRDSDSGVREACGDAIGLMSGIYIVGESENGVVSLFARPLFEAMGENNKNVQGGAAMCLGRVVECAKKPPVSGFQKLCPRICKYLNSPNFFAKSALLPVVSSLSQVGAIPPQSLETLLPSIHECLSSTDWATRKAAADTLIALAMHSKDLVKDVAASTLTVLEACRFDKIKPVRDSMTEALQLWKKIAGKSGEGALDESKVSPRDAENPGPSESSSNYNQKHTSVESKADPSAKDSSNVGSSDSIEKTKNGSVSDKAVGILKKKVPALTDKDLNPEFFQKLEKRGQDDLPVEVVVPRKCTNSSNMHGEETEPNDSSTKANADKESARTLSKQRGSEGYARDRWADDGVNGKDSRARTFGLEDRNGGFSKADGQSEGSSMNNKGNWLAIQRQLLHLERQQVHLMTMLQDFMGGSHNSMVTLENRVRGLERVVEDMSIDLSMSTGRRAGHYMSGFEGSSNRPSRYHGLFDHSGRIPCGDRYPPSDGIPPSMRGRGAPWRSDPPESWDFHSYGSSKSAQMGSRRDVGGNSMDGRSPRSDHENDQAAGRRAWDKGAGPVRLGEGPSARSVWQASKDEATLQAIRVAGEDNGTKRSARVAVPEMDSEAIGNDNHDRERERIWTPWSNAMHALQMGDMDTAYAEVLSIEDEPLLVKLMDRSGPVFDRLSSEVAVELLISITPLVVEQNLFDICVSWVQQLLDVVMENGPDVFDIPLDVKKELLLNLEEACSTIELPEDWDGATPIQLMLQLASAWGIDLQHHGS